MDENKTYAVVYQNGDPVWDVKADAVAFALGMDDGKLMVPVLRQHTDPAAKSGFAKEYSNAVGRSVSGLKIKGDNIELQDPNDAPFKEFVDLHFEKFYGVSTDDVSAHKKFLNDRSYLKARIFREGVQGISYEEDDSEAASDNDFIFDITDTSGVRKVTVFQKLFSIERNRVERIDMEHTLKEVTEDVYQKFRKATTRHLQARKKKLLTIEDHDTMAAIYKELIQSVSGVVVDGKPCKLDNKNEWVDLIPLEHKLFVVSILMREIEGKNVS